MSILVTLREQIKTHCRLDRFEDLCFELGTTSEDLSGDTLHSKSRELVKYCQRHDRLPDLIELVDAEKMAQGRCAIKEDTMSFQAIAMELIKWAESFEFSVQEDGYLHDVPPGIYATVEKARGMLAEEAERAERPHKRERAMRMAQTVDVTLAGGRVLLLARSDGNPDVFANASAALHRCDQLKCDGLPCHVLFDGAYYIRVEREQWGVVS